MGTLNPRARGIRTLGTERADATADRQQIRRLVSQREKPPVPLTSGYLGTAQLTSTPGSVVHSGTGTRVDEGAVTYGAPVDPHAGTGGEGLAPSGWCSVTDGFQIALAEGWYSLAVMVDIAWTTAANAPDWFDTYLAGVPNEIQEFTTHPAVTGPSGRRGIRKQLQTGIPFYAGFGPLWLEVEFGAHTGTSDTLVGLGGSVSASHVWTIVKHT